MFSLEIYPSTLTIIILEIIILIVQSFNVLTRISDKSRFRFLFLTCAFLFYNISSIFMPDDVSGLASAGEAIFSFVRGVILAGVYFYYLVVELGIEQRKLFNVRVLVVSLLLTFLFGFGTIYVLTGNVSESVEIMRYLPIVVSLYFAFMTLKFVVRQRVSKKDINTPFRAMITSGYIGIIFIASMPFFVMLGDMKLFNVIIVNIAYLLMCYAYYLRYMFQVKLENEMLARLGYLNNDEGTNSRSTNVNDFELTNREKEVAFLILNGYTYKEISEEMFIAQKTVSKHASNIFKKTQCANREDFELIFSKRKSINSPVQ